MPEVLVLYYSRNGHTAELARHVARGVEEVDGMQARVRTVPAVRTGLEPDALPSAVPDDGPPYVSSKDLTECIALAIGSPTRFGNMAAPLKYFIDGLVPEWLSGALAGKPATVFTSTGTQHGGQEATLLSMMIPLFHHGMIIVGLPYTEARLSNTTSGGTPYGASHVSGARGDKPISEDERELARAAGRRLATIASKLVKVPA
jgi:NAD(P)H dehydrogenase (quinone)